MSSVSELDETSNWLEMVDMIAARIAASRKPVTSGWNNTWLKKMKMVSGSTMLLPVLRT